MIGLIVTVSIMLISIVLLQAGKAESTGSIISGGNADLFNNRKERGGELFISRLTFALGIIFMIICFFNQK